MVETLRGRAFTIRTLFSSVRRFGIAGPAGPAVHGQRAAQDDAPPRPGGIAGGQRAAMRWRERGAEARAMADQMLEGPARATMYDMAARYDTMARLAAQDGGVSIDLGSRTRNRP